MEIDSHNLKATWRQNRSAEVKVEEVCHCWHVQQWNPGTSATLLGKPAVAPAFNNPTGNKRRLVAGIRRNRWGYSYIELTVVLLICSILGTAAIPRYTDALFRLRVDAAAKRVAADITYLQRQALYRSSSQSIVFTPNGGSGTPNSYSMPTVQYVDFAAAGAVVNLAQEPYSATIVSASFLGSNTLTFDRYGVPSNGGTVVVAAGGYQKTVQVDSSTGDVNTP